MVLKIWLQRIERMCKDFKRRYQKFSIEIPNFVFLCVVLIEYFSVRILLMDSVTVGIRAFALGFVSVIVVLIFIIYKFLIPEEEHPY